MACALNRLGCTATDEDGLQGSPLYQWQFAVQIIQQGLHIGIFRQLLRSSMGIEITIGTFAYTPGDVYVERQRRQAHACLSQGPICSMNWRTALPRWLYFCFCSELSSALAQFEFGNEKQRVIAETIMTAWSIQNDTFPASLTDQRGRVLCVTHEHQHALEAGTALLGGHLFKRLQQLTVVLVIAAAGAGVARRVDPRCTIQRIHFQP